MCVCGDGVLQCYSKKGTRVCCRAPRNNGRSVPFIRNMIRISYCLLSFKPSIDCVSPICVGNRSLIGMVEKQRIGSARSIRFLTFMHVLSRSITYANN
jgi:hypothetical protein